MNLNRLKQAEADFLQMFPEGFEDESLVSVRKRHNLSRMNRFAMEAFAEDNFFIPDHFLEGLVKVISRSSMISMFEKPRFRDLISSLNSSDRERLTSLYQELFHGNQGKAFEDIVEMLAPYKMAKWSLITIGLAYFRPDEEVFVKPTTTKKIIAELDLDLVYRPKPTWEFYKKYRATVLEMKKRVHSSIAPNNAALTGFLMITL